MTIPFMVNGYMKEQVFSYVVAFEQRPYLSFLNDVYLLVYLLLSIGLFNGYKKMVKANYSSVTVSNIQWLKKFLFSLLFVLGVDFMTTTYELIFGFFTTWDTGYITLLFLIAIVVFLGYNGIRQNAVYLPEFLFDYNDRKTSRQLRTNIGITNEEIDALNLKLNDVLLQKKPYLSPDLTLNALASLVDTTDKKLSSLLNHTLDTSFYDFINRYRIEAVKEKLESEEFKKYSLLGIGYACGFNSKSSFYRAFKKETGSSPTSYKKGLISETSSASSKETKLR